MIRVKIDGASILTWDSFHDVFSESFGFPDFYGRNMNAWIDCMSSLDDPDSGMTSVTCNKSDYCVIEVLNADKFKVECNEAYQAFLECSAFVNFRLIEMGYRPLIMLAFK